MGTSQVGAISEAQKQKLFTKCSGRFYEKLTKKFRNTQRMPSVLGKRFRSLDLESETNALF